MDPTGSVTYWIDQLKAGQRESVQPLWEEYYRRLILLARSKLQGVACAAADEEDAVLSAFASFCRAAEGGRFPQLHDRDDLWKLLVVITERKSANLLRDQCRQKRGGGRVQGEAILDREGHGAGGLDRFPGPEPTPEFAAMVAEEYQMLLDLLGDEVLRGIAVLKMEGYANEEIAARYGLSLRTVERKLALIRQIWAERAPAE